MLKAFVLFFILEGSPVALMSYDTQAECNAALASAKLTLTAQDALLHRCASQADYQFGLDLDGKRLVEELRMGRD